MANWYGKTKVNEDFQEDDVWGGFVKEEKEDSSLKMIKKDQKAHRRQKSSGSTCSSAWNLNGEAAQRMNIPRTQETKVVVPRHLHHQSSAPVNVPDWSKIYSGRKSNKSMVGVEDGDQECVGYEEEDDDGEEMVPPHEYIARRMARTQISSFSMCEGAGRTLKGRDLRKVRNAILTKTGFLE